MHPATSVILFTTSSGVGYGMLMVLGLLAAAGVVDPALLFLTAFPAFALITLGLLSSTLHLGHPERAWRALSQWRSSWLSREGVIAIATYVPAGMAIFAELFLGDSDGVWAIATPLTALLALGTVICTGMIYASLKPIPRWHNGWVVPVYVFFALATGAAWLMPFALYVQRETFEIIAWLTCGLFVAAWLVKLGYWRASDRDGHRATVGRAIGIEHLGPVRMLEGPHTGPNYVMREMGYAIGRRHAARLRRIAVGLGALITPVVAAFSAFTYNPAVSLGLCVVVVVAGSLSVIIERWLFFAEAEHMSMLYYGQDQ